MKKFIKNVFVLSFLLIFIVSASILKYKSNLGNLKFKRSFSTLICGDSHTKSALNDEIYRDALNISLSGEHYLYTYNVLKRIFHKNSQVKNIVLGCSFHSFSEKFDKYIYESAYTAFMYPRYLPILDNPSLAQIWKRNSKDVLKAANNTFKCMVSPIISNAHDFKGYPFIGSYYGSNENNLVDSIVDFSINGHFYLENNQEQSFSSQQVFYLNKIVTLCEESNVKLVVLNTPISKKYYDKIPTKFIVNYYKTLASFGNRINFMDFNAMKLDNTCFGDGDHLNYRGAKIFTTRINNIMNSKTIISKK